MITRFDSNDRMSQAVRYGDSFETAGQVARDTSRGIVEQTHDVLDAIDGLLKKLGATKDELTRVQVWLSDMSHFDEMNVVYEKWLSGHAKPVRACVESRLADPAYLIEMQAFGFLG
ncbi:RidA family protein [Paraburkholderia sp. MPAMCS5]|uniref:RidA family protein n=1 Tax=Paraburkholderia sp. MPAMCS5 TaxID=3112563 RepID=UPI002E179533|nr:RidA family protein [Paraburkholderia sp. MPAMCS5]